MKKMKILTTALAIMASSVAFGQWTGTGPVYTYDDVGINTTAPQAELHVVGDMILASTSNPFLLFYDAGAGTGSANGYVGLQGTTTTLKALTGNVSISSGNLVGNSTVVAGHDAVNFALTDISSPTNNDFNWTNGLTSLMSLSGAGNLQIKAGGLRVTRSSTPTMFLYNSAGYVGGMQEDGASNILLTAANKIRFSTGGTGAKMVLDASGRVGIGMNAPLAPLHIKSVGTTINSAIRISAGLEDWYLHLNGNDDFLIKDDGVTAITFQNSTRNVGIGTTNPLHRLHVGGDVAVSGQIVHPSDARLKENIQPIKNALTTIGQLNPSTYTHRANQTAEFELAKGKQYGLIAQEVEKVLPELVIQKTLIAKDGTIYKGINYEKLLPILVAAVKEQQQIIDGLREENAETTLNHNKRLMEIEETLQVLQNTNEVKASK